MVPLSPLRESLHKQTAKELIRDKLVSLIASGILQMNDEIPSERELASMLSVSRETVRGAIQRLVGEGIVQVSQGARTRVAKIDVNIATRRIGIANPSAINGYDLEAVHGARLLVETATVRDAALRMSDADIGRLKDSLEVQRDSRDDPVRFLICDREFHLTIYYASSNRLLADFVVDLYTYMLDHRRAAMGKPGAIARSLLDHEAIVSALGNRDPDGVADAFRQHILRIHDTTMALGPAEPSAREPLVKFPAHGF
jgi:DNA-binding FadR family transcriptional regulator